MSTLENIIKQGYLKKGNTGGNRLSGLLRKIEGQKWFVFTVRQGVPYLEYYDNNTEVFTQKPVNSYCLSQCYNVTSLIRTNPPSFIIACSDRCIELTASSRPQMLEWVQDVERTMTRLGILKKETIEHVYTAFPAAVRQPRVSEEVLKERGINTAIDNSTQSAPSLDTNSSSSPHPPPLPQRPSVFKSQAGKKLENLSCNVSQAATDSEPELVGATAAADISNNDSDFVSWDVVMRVRESFLQRNDKGLSLRLGEEEDNSWKCEGGATSVAQDNSDSDDIYNLSRNRTQSANSLDFAALPNSSSVFPSVGACSDFSIGLMISDSQKSQVEENEYSLLPSSLMNEVEDRVDRDEDKAKVRPVPMPRRALTLKSNSQEKEDLINGINREGGCSAAKGTCFDPFEECSTNVKQNATSWLQNDFQAVNLLGKENETPNHLDEILDDSETFQDKDENANFYDKENSTSHCVLAPPTIPPRYDSLAGWTPPIPISTAQDFTNNLDVYSHPISSSALQSLFPTPNVTSISAFSDSLMFFDTESSSTSQPSPLQPAIPPLPIPRSKKTKPTSLQGAFHSTDNSSPFTSLDIPPQIPRRTQLKSINPQDDTPPQLPSRNRKSILPRLTSSFSFAENDEKAKLLDDNVSVGSAVSLQEREKKATTLAASTPSSRQSGLAKKMLLDRANSLHTVVSLKQTQADILQTEIDKSHIGVTLTRKSGHGLALVDWNDMPCVAGWNQKDFPSLHGKLHIGDMLISVNHVRVLSAEMAQKLLRHAPDIKIEVTLQRMPHAKVFAIRRSAEGQSLGLKREGGTGEILYVDPNGLAAYHGLPQYATGTMGKSRCTWFLTEINSRPLNLFFKENEIEHLLYAVGREISIVVQPSDFVLEIRRGLKKLKNHKHFITQ